MSTEINILNSSRLSKLIAGILLGGPEDVQLAEILIHQTIAAQPR